MKDKSSLCIETLEFVLVRKSSGEFGEIRHLFFVAAASRDNCRVHHKRSYITRNKCIFVDQNARYIYSNCAEDSAIFLCNKGEIGVRDSLITRLLFHAFERENK